jgi:diacylglycerol kinase (ATP)
MRVTLLHNPKAGHDGLSDDEVVALLEDGGYEVDYQSVKKKKWKKALDDLGDLVVVAGGDGTVAKVAIELVGRGVPLAILPVGTANNIATSLGIEGELNEVVAGWADAHRRRFDIGLVSGPWGETRFLEAVGFGLFTQSMALVETKEEVRSPDDRDAELERDLRFLRMTLDATRSHLRHVSIDGEDLSGEYFLVEVMNTACIGPNLCLAPQAEPGDGRLDVVLLGEHERERFEAYLDGHIAGGTEPLHLPVRTARTVHFRWQGLPLHVDDHIYADPSMTDRPTRVEIRLEGEVELLLGGR